MTRVAVVAESEDVRAALAAALRASPAFEVVDAGAAVADVAGDSSWWSLHVNRAVDRA